MYNLDINKGDTILTGKWKNKKEKVKTFGHDKNMQPTINGKSMLKFRIEKLMPKKEEIEELMKKSDLKALIIECVQELKEEKEVITEASISKTMAKAITNEFMADLFGQMNASDLMDNYAQGIADDHEMHPEEAYEMIQKGIEAGEKKFKVEMEKELAKQFSKAGM